MVAIVSSILFPHQSALTSCDRFLSATPTSGADVDAGDLPPAEPNPLVIAGVEIPLFWRNKRIVAVEEDRVTEELRSAVDAKGVRLFVLPASPDYQKQVLEDLKSALKE